MQKMLVLINRLDIKRRKAKALYGLRTMPGIALQFGALFLFWLILSGHFQVEYIVLGVLSAGLVTFLTHDLLSSVFRHGEKQRTNLIPFTQIWRFLIYLLWLLSKIVMANLRVAYLVLHPRMPIAPAMLQFRTRLQRDISKVIVANSITLTPGTITVSLENGKYIVHALAPSLASSILKAQLQNKVGKIFMEEKEKPPAPLWAHSLEELEL